MYARVQPNEIYPAVRGDLIRGVHTVRSAADVAGLVANDLEPAAIELCPGIAETLASVRAAGALAAAVSGSGPTVFGLFADRASAEAAGALIPGSIATAQARAIPSVNPPCRFAQIVISGSIHHVGIRPASAARTSSIVQIIIKGMARIWGRASM